MDAYDRAIAYAKQRGAEDGKARASWYFDGNTSRETYAATLRGIEDGDPAVLDTLPHADLSGEYADTLTGPELVEAAIINADDWTMPRAAWIAYWAAREPFTDVCDAYEQAFADAAVDAITIAARYQVRESK